MFELLVAAKMLLTAPQMAVGTDRARIEARFGAPDGVGTDFLPASGDNPSAGKLMTLDWPDLRIRLFESGETHHVQLVGVTTTRDVLKIGSPVHIGVDRGTVLRELGGPAYEDEDQIVYSLNQQSGVEPNDTVRLVLKDDRIVGIDWTYPLETSAP